MPAQYSSHRANFTPTLNGGGLTYNYLVNVFTSTLGDRVIIRKVAWGGRNLTSSNYRTRWVRPATNPGGGATTSLAVQVTNPGVAAPSSPRIYTTSVGSLTFPADPAGLFAVDWDAQGGQGVLSLPLSGSWWVVNNHTTVGQPEQNLACMNMAGTDPNVTTYSVYWDE